MASSSKAKDAALRVRAGLAHPHALGASFEDISTMVDEILGPQEMPIPEGEVWNNTDSWLGTFVPVGQRDEPGHRRYIPPRTRVHLG